MTALEAARLRLLASLRDGVHAHWQTVASVGGEPVSGFWRLVEGRNRSLHLCGTDQCYDEMSGGMDTPRTKTALYGG